jgi:hypothetical protein
VGAEGGEAVRLDVERQAVAVLGMRVQDDHDGCPKQHGAYIDRLILSRGYERLPTFDQTRAALRSAPRRPLYVAQRRDPGRRSGQARRNSVEVLLRRYAGCLDNQAESVNRRIERAMRDDISPEIEH